MKRKNREGDVKEFNNKPKETKEDLILKLQAKVEMLEKLEEERMLKEAGINV